MGTILYILLHLIGVVDELQDWVNLCFLVALDQIFWIMVLQFIVQRRVCRRPVNVPASDSNPEGRG